MEHGKTMKVVYAITERSGKSYWTRIGVGFANKDGSLQLRLDALPTNGTMQVRDWEPRDDQRGDGERQAETRTARRNDDDYAGSNGARHAHHSGDALL